MRTIILFSVSLLSLTGCQTGVRKPVSQYQGKLNEAAFLLETNSISAIQLVHSPQMEHPFRITLDSLVAGSAYSLKLSGQALDTRASKLAEALRSSDAVGSADWNGDVTWGIVLYNNSGKEVVRIGFDNSGRNGYLGTQAVRLNGRLLKLATKMLPE